MVFCNIKKKLMNAIIKYMKRNYKALLVIVGLSIALLSFIPKEETDPEKDKLLLELFMVIPAER